VSHITKKIFLDSFVTWVLQVLLQLLGVLEHFGKSPSCALITGTLRQLLGTRCAIRVFATFGQPNWMAGWMAAILPLTFVLFFVEKSEKLKKFWWLGAGLFTLFTLALLFTNQNQEFAVWYLCDTFFCTYLHFSLQ